MGTVKDSNGKDLIEAEEIQNRWQNTQKNCTKKILMTWITMIMWSLTYSQTSLKCEVKWVLGSTTMNKASRCDGFQLNYFKSSKMMKLKFCTQYASKLENSVVDTGLVKVSFLSNLKERQCHRMFKL